MAVWILDGVTNGKDEHACLVDSVTETAFGPLFKDYGEADTFVGWCLDVKGVDPRKFTTGQLMDLQAEFRAIRANEEPDDDYCPHCNGLGSRNPEDIGGSMCGCQRRGTGRMSDDERDY